MAGAKDFCCFRHKQTLFFQIHYQHDEGQLQRIKTIKWFLRAFIMNRMSIITINFHTETA